VTIPDNIPDPMLKIARTTVLRLLPLDWRLAGVSWVEGNLLRAEMHVPSMTAERQGPFLAVRYGCDVVFATGETIEALRNDAAAKVLALAEVEALTC
jgi:hypothetical protein